MHPVATTGSRPYRGSLRRPSAILPAPRGGAVGLAEASCGRPQPGPSAGHRSSPPGRGGTRSSRIAEAACSCDAPRDVGEVSRPVAIARFLMLSVLALAIAVAPAAQPTTPRHTSLAGLTVAEPSADPHDGGWGLGIVPAPDDGDVVGAGGRAAPGASGGCRRRPAPPAHRAAAETHRLTRAAPGRGRPETASPSRSS